MVLVGESDVLVWPAAIEQVEEGWLALITSRVAWVSGFLVMGLAVTASLFFGFVLSMVPVYETSRRHLMIAEVSKHDLASVHTPAETAL